MNFTFYLPTRVVSGANCISENSSLMKGMGSHAFIMTGKSSAEKNGSLADMTSALKEQGIAWTHYNRVNPNPTLEEVRSASEEARAAGADLIIALGGGSPMDAAKAVAVLAGTDLTDEELLGQQSFEKVLPLIAVPTTSGTGSEVTPYSILTNNTLKTKSFLRSEQIYPKIAFLDGRYTLKLPATITAATVIDALSHAAEGYLAVRAIPPAQALALESLEAIGKLLPVLKNAPDLSLEQREELLYASMVAGIVIAQSGTTAVHALGYSLTYFKGLDHGLANGLLMAEYFRYIRQSRPEEIACILNALRINSIDAFDDYLKDLLGTTNLTPQEVDQFADIAVKAGNIQNTLPRPSREDLHKILTNCFIK